MEVAVGRCHGSSAFTEDHADRVRAVLPTLALDELTRRKALLADLADPIGPVGSSGCGHLDLNGKKSGDLEVGEAGAITG